MPSFWRAVLMLVVAGFHVLLTAGIVFGWASLKQRLSDEFTLCVIQVQANDSWVVNVTGNITVPDNEEEAAVCDGQQDLFTLIFALGTVGNLSRAKAEPSSSSAGAATRPEAPAALGGGPSGGFGVPLCGGCATTPGGGGCAGGLGPDEGFL